MIEKEVTLMARFMDLLAENEIPVPEFLRGGRSPSWTEPAITCRPNSVNCSTP